MSSSNQVTVVWHTSKTQTFEDAKKRETLIGSTGAGSVSTQLPALFNNLLGTKFKIITGYPDGREVDIAMERGEVEGRGTNPWASYKSAQPRLVRDKLIRPIIQIGLEKEPDLPDVPLLLDQPVAPEDKPVLEFMSKAVMVGAPSGRRPACRGTRQRAAARIRRNAERSGIHRRNNRTKCGNRLHERRNPRQDHRRSDQRAAIGARARKGRSAAQGIRHAQERQRQVTH